MYSIILVPLDGSKRAETILPHVQDIAQRYQAKVVLLSVMETPNTIVAPDGIYIPSEDIIAEHYQQLEAYLEKQKQALEALGITVVARVEQGHMVDAICEIAAEENADLVALASHGRTGLAQVFFGSVATGVLHRLTRPLLLVRAN
jgi:nucleotide-binding universal stress UspA family protein